MLKPINKTNAKTPVINNPAITGYSFSPLSTVYTLKTMIETLENTIPRIRWNNQLVTVKIKSISILIKILKFNDDAMLRNIFHSTNIPYVICKG
jgi:hypothetical protein